jgi:hypothetical protein
MGRPHIDGGDGHMALAQAKPEETKSIKNEDMAGAADSKKNRKRPHRQRRSEQANDEGFSSMLNGSWIAVK